jgi:hypothetical protein
MGSFISKKSKAHMNWLNNQFYWFREEKEILKLILRF